MENYQFDSIFLKKLDYQKTKEFYVRIISLTNDEYPKEEILGRVTGGSINIDGSSAIRRSCSLSLNALESDTIITDDNWYYDTKFKLEIGVKNYIDKNYPDIIWFKMGTYIITSFSKSKSTNSLSISISGKDKMCRLNGEISGNLMVSTDFGTIEEIMEDGYTTITKLPIKTIIHNVVRQYGGEKAENIVINDLEQYGFELWEYKGSDPIYFYIDPNYNAEQGAVIGMTFDGATKVKYASGKQETLKNFTGKFYSMNTLDKSYNEDASIIRFCEKDCHIAKIEYGETAGYHRVPLVYGSDLILNAGDSVTTVLDKLKQMLGDFEYFYDVNGKFVFQKQNTYIYELFSTSTGELAAPTLYESQYSYKFEDEELFTSISSSPKIDNLKNDFSIWGTRKSVSGGQLPIHARYAIDKKPTKYINLEGKEFLSTKYDWRELIYQMALDYYKHNQDSEFLITLQDKNPQFIEGITGYEQYYTDMQAFWRQLYNPKITPQDLSLAQSLGYEYYDENSPYAHWNKQIHLSPTTLNFWIDFLDTEGELGKYSIKHYENNKFKTGVGIRTKSVNETSIGSIYFNETPEVLFLLPNESLIDYKMSYKPIWIQDDIASLFYRSSQGMSAIAKANELIYQHVAIAESLSLSVIPIYYLQPNTRIYVKGYGDYILNKISYSLNANGGTMSLSGNKIFKQFY